ncbi:MAG: hypothetical protein ACK4IX_13055, partial [Candidatus Sericytochromatia bacterium]
MKIIIKSISVCIISFSIFSCSSTNDVLIDDINKSKTNISSSSNPKTKDPSNIKSTYIELEFDGKYVTSLQEETIGFFRALGSQHKENISDWSIDEIGGNNNGSTNRKYRFTLYGQDIKKLYD